MFIEHLFQIDQFHVLCELRRYARKQENKYYILHGDCFDSNDGDRCNVIKSYWFVPNIISYISKYFHNMNCLDTTANLFGKVSLVKYNNNNRRSRGSQERLRVRGISVGLSDVSGSFKGNKVISRAFHV